MDELKECVEAVKRNVESIAYWGFKTTEQGCFNDDLVYAWTNEDINGYLSVSGCKPSSALTVLSSGDHPFNLITLGAKDVDTFDYNRLTEFYALGFKRAMILKYNYSDFRENMDNIIFGLISWEEVNDLMQGLYSYMDERHKMFFQEIIGYTSVFFKEGKIPANNMIDALCRDDSVPMSYLLYGNNFLLDEGNYNKLRSNLARANITFKALDAINLSREYQKKYDAILLSNILDFFYKFKAHMFKFKDIFEYEKQLEKLLNRNGVLFLYYVFKVEDDIRKIYPFNRKNISLNNLVEEEFIKFPNCSGYNSAITLKREGSKTKTIKI